MTRLIDVDAVMRNNLFTERDRGFLLDAPTIDAVEVVRCKDCKHKVTTKDGEYNPEDIVCDYWSTDGLEETDFCSYGERKGGGEE